MVKIFVVMFSYGRISAAYGNKYTTYIFYYKIKYNKLDKEIAIDISYVVPSIMLLEIAI